MVQVVGIGIDIVDISRFKRLKLIKKSKFLNRIFTKCELDYCFSRKNIASSLATKFAGKEAVIKAFSSTNKINLDYREIEIINNSSGGPKVNLNGKQQKKFQILISLSNEAERAVGVAILINK